MTTLAGDDTYVNVQRLCYRSINPVSKELLEKLISTGEIKSSQSLHVAAVCVYPARINDCVISSLLKNVNLAAVATGFPSGQYSLDSRLSEIKYARDVGATEIDIVINRAHALNGCWKAVYDELKIMCEIAGENIKVKAILEVGELFSFENIYKASWAAMLAGADFIKTSTGKAAVNATLPVGVVMTRAIKDFEKKFNKIVGLKPAGGIKSEFECLCWLKLIELQFDPNRIDPQYFRFGASSLLNELEKSLFKYLFNRKPKPYELSL